MKITRKFQEKCETSPAGKAKRAENNRNERVAKLIKKYFDTKDDVTSGSCPYCWAGSYVDSYEQYEAWFEVFCYRLD